MAAFSSVCAGGLRVVATMTALCLFKFWQRPVAGSGQLQGAQLVQQRPVARRQCER
jgi:hypothetical protein